MGVLDLFGLGGGGHTPIAADLPAQQASLDKKWGELSPFLGDLPSTVPQSIYALDRDRVLQGKAPMSRPETARALLSAAQGQTVTKSPTRNVANVPGNALHDARNIAASIFRLPGALINEVQELPELPSQLAATLAEGKNPGETLHDVSQLPGIRMIPGAYAAGNVARGTEGFRELAEHPLFTALDLLPAGSRLAAGTKVAKASAAAGIAVNRPLKALLMQRLDESDVVVRSALGQMVDTAAHSRSGTVLKAGFSAGARQASRIKNFADEALFQAGTDGLTIPERYLAVQKVAETKRASAKLRKDFPEMADNDWIIDTTRKMELGDYPNMDARQLAFKGRVRDLDEAYSEYAMSKDWLGQFDNEYYPIAQANKLHAAQRKHERAVEMADLRAGVLNPSGTIDDALDIARKELAGAGSIAERKLRATTALYQADALGADARGVISAVRRARGADIDNVAIPAAAGLKTTKVAAMNDLVTVVNKYGGTWTRAGELKQAIRSEDWGAASRISRAIMGNKKATIPELADFIDQIDHLRRRDRFLTRLADRDHSAAAKLGDKAEKLAANAVPGRFVPSIEKGVHDTVIGRVTKPEDVARVTQALYERRYDNIVDALPGGKLELMDLAQSAAKTWQDLRAAGVDPVFVHRVSPERLPSIARPKVTEIPRSATQIKERTWDFSPYTRDASIALEHQGLELLARHGSEAFIDEMITKFGKTRAEVEAITRDRAVTRSATGDPRFVSFEGELDALVKREWTSFNPEKAGYNWGSERLSQIGAADYFLPKYIADNLERWHNPKVTPVRAIADPLMKTFRTALLPFSPRWHVNNIVGGGIVMSAEAGPLVWRRLPEAIKMIREGTIPEQMLLRLRAQYDVYADMAIMEGKTFGRTMQEAESHRLNKAGAAMSRAADATEGVRGVLKKAEAKSYEFNQYVDSVYRTMALLEGSGKAAKKGLSQADQLEAGLQLADKVLPAWAEMTPIERGIMRYVFPFYAWTSYITRFALRYPFDHPLRMSIMASVTRIALEDLGEDGLPEAFLNVGFFGNTDDDGNQRAFRAGAMNPFADVANAFTVLGLASSSNPAISTLLEQMGYAGGRLEAYPTLRFDPETGRLAATPPQGILSSLLANTIPQSQILMAITGSNREFSEMARTNPAAARRSLLAAAGIPVPIRTYNIAQELAKRQQATQADQTTTKAEAIRSGDWSRAQRFPGLTSTFARLGELEGTDTLAPFVANPDAIPVQLASLGQRASTGGV